MVKGQAVRIRAAGGPEVLELGAYEVREPGHGEVLVQVAAAGLNRADLVQRRGHYPAPPGFPADVPGLEFAGTVQAVGAGVTDWKPGDRVMAISGGGAMATHVVAHERELLPVPDALTLEQAAAVPEVFLTAWDAVFVQGGLRMGETLLVHAVGSGVGTAALQLAKVAGARVFGTSRTQDKLDRCARLGLDAGLLVGKDGAFSDRVPGGADVVLDAVGGAYLPENVRVLAPGGRLVLLGTMGGAKGELPVFELMRRRGRVIGTVLRGRPLEEKAQLAQAFRRDVLPLFASGRLRPIVDDVLEMSRVAEAHERLESNQTFGKLVLRW